MPVFKSGKGLAPAWCELESFEIVRLAPGEGREFKREGKKEKLIVGAGHCVVRCGGVKIETGEGSNLDFEPPAEPYAAVAGEAGATLIRMRGRWGDKTGGSGLFGVRKAEVFQPAGDPWNYPKDTNFDNHYHDCDEYWILYEGRGVAVSEGKSFEVGPGDCVVTGMGQHHDFPQAFEPVRAVYFETTLEGRKRLGHLWDHAHGPASPDPKRI